MSKKNKTIADIAAVDDGNMARVVAGARLSEKQAPPASTFPEGSRKAMRVIEQLSNERRGISGEVIEVFPYPGDGNGPHGKAYPAAIFRQNGQLFMAMRADRPGYLDSVFTIMTASKAAASKGHPAAVDYNTVQYPIDADGEPISYGEAEQLLAEGELIYYERILKLG